MSTTKGAISHFGIFIDLSRHVELRKKDYCLIVKRQIISMEAPTSDNLV